MLSKSDRYRDNAKKAKAVANALAREDMRRTALEIAEGWEKLAEQAQPKSEPASPRSATKSQQTGTANSLLR